MRWRVHGEDHEVGRMGVVTEVKPLLNVVSAVGPEGVVLIVEL
jgi:hypothetical protein